jgi:two-component system, cell cycle sensor histidine kinase and response regulator CckA
VFDKQGYEDLEKRINELEKENSILRHFEKQSEEQENKLETLSKNIEQSEERYRDMVELSPFGILTFDLKGLVTSANHAFLNLSSYSEKEIVNKYIPQLPTIDKALVPEYLKIFASVLKRKSALPIVFPWIHKDGSKRMGEAYAAPLKKGKRIMGLQALVLDITERKKAEEELQSNSEIIRNINEGIFLVGRADNKIKYANAKFNEMLGYNPGELIGKDASMLNSPTERTPTETIDQIRETHIKTEEWHGEVKNIKKDGTHLWCYANVSIFDHGTFGRVSVSANLDITERKQVEKELLDAQDLLVEAQRMAKIGSWQRDLITNEISWSKEVYTIFGLDETYQPSLESVAEWIHPDDRWVVAPETVEKNIQRGIQSAEYRIIDQKTKAIKYVVNKGETLKDSEGKPVRNIGLFQDVTERRLAEEQLKVSLTKYQVLFDSFPLGVTVTDKAGNIKESNKEAERLLGLPTTKQQKRRIDGREWTIIGADGTPMPADEYASVRALKEKRLVENVVMGIVKGTGDITWINVTAAPIPLEDYGVAIAYGDITDRKNTEDALRKSEEQLKQAQKLESVGQFAGGVAHDFNNILTTIIGYSDIIFMAEDLTDTMRKAVQEIRNSSDRAASLTKQLLAFSRKQIMRPQQINLNKLILNTTNMLLRLIPENISFNTMLGSEIEIIKADPGQLEQVFMNLVVNAVDAMPEGGKQTVETKNTHQEISHHPEHLEFIPGDYVELTVSDTGDGMDKETLAQVFDPFFTTKDVGKGTGLGLSTVYGIVKQSDGYIWGDSDLGKGSTFTVWFPVVVAEELETEGPSAQEQKEKVSGEETILFVEDEEQIRTVVKLILTSQGYSIIEASNGNEALSVIEEAGYPNIDCLITDVIMPEMGGKELSEELLEKYPKVKTLFISGYSEDSISHHHVLNEGTYFLEKPFSTQALSEKIREMLDADN